MILISAINNDYFRSKQLSLQQNCCNKLERLIISLESNKKLVEFCLTSGISFTNFDGVGLDFYVNLSDRIWSREKRSPFISALAPALLEQTGGASFFRCHDYFFNAR